MATPPDLLVDDVERYFAGDLDVVERRQLEQRLVEDPARAAAFDVLYDARLSRLGLLALQPTDPELSDCFSPATLERYVLGQLDGIDAATVEAHLGCNLCAEQVQAL